MKLKYRVIERFRDTYPVKAMCEAFEVSRSGYYSWCKVQKEMPKDQWLVDLIVECQQQCNQTYGIRRVRRLIQQDQPACADSTAKNVYSAQEKCIQITNLLQRAFEQCKPNSFWATDIAYIPTPKGMLYIYAVRDYPQFCVNLLRSVK